jgi:hypothetical protein
VVAVSLHMMISECDQDVVLSAVEIECSSPNFAID